MLHQAVLDKGVPPRAMSGREAISTQPPRRVHRHVHPPVHRHGAEFDASAGTNKLPGDAVRYYIDTLKDPDRLRGSFGFYRAVPATSAQNQQRKERRLTLPVLAIGGAESSGEGVGNTMKLAADDVQTLVITGCGHWVAEQAPERLLTALSTFLAPCRDGTAAAHN
jgi:pimeloyl-ACP methyl ester carboxylesterase